MGDMRDPEIKIEAIEDFGHCAILIFGESRCGWKTTPCSIVQRSTKKLKYKGSDYYKQANNYGTKGYCVHSLI